MTKILKTIKEVREINGGSVGLVPTMGSLHKGHLSLIERSVKENDITIVSIFVNPTQFGVNEDFDSYPRNLLSDLEFVEKTGAQYIFAPEVSEIYPSGFDTFVEAGKVADLMCGVKRPAHFRGVATIVIKLINICRPVNIYFGQKDFQQTVLIKKIVKELDLDTNVIVCKTVREADGLAMSSRNAYLTKKERMIAPDIYTALKNASAVIQNGENDPRIVIKQISKDLGSKFQIEYIEIRDQINLEILDKIDKDAVIAIALKLGNTRLIDNFLIWKG